MIFLALEKLQLLLSSDYMTLKKITSADNSSCFHKIRCAKTTYREETDLANKTDDTIL